MTVHKSKIPNADPGDPVLVDRTELMRELERSEAALVAAREQLDTARDKARPYEDKVRSAWSAMRDRQAEYEKAVAALRDSLPEFVR